jgi:hypothetical protein
MKKILLLLFLGICIKASAQKKISDETNLSSGLASGIEEFRLAKSGANYKMSLNSLKTWLSTSLGTVSSFSSGNLSPLFTTSVASSTTTPALSFTLSNSSPYKLFGRGSGTGVPSYQSLDSNFFTSFYTLTRASLGGAQGDITGNWPNLQVYGIYGIPIEAPPLLAADMMVYDGFGWNILSGIGVTDGYTIARNSGDPLGVSWQAARYNSYATSVGFILTQKSADDPITHLGDNITPIFNEHTGITYDWKRDADGIYHCSASSAIWSSSNTVVKIGAGSMQTVGSGVTVNAQVLSTTSIEIEVYDTNTGAFVDEGIENCEIIISTYP